MPQNVTPPPVPTQQPMVDPQTRLATRPWVAWFTTLGQLFGFNQSIEADGVPVPQELAINFLSPLTVTDNPGNGSTDIGLNISRVDDAQGSFLELPDGTLIEWGQSNAAGTGGPKVTVNVTFPQPFTAPPIVTCGPDNQPDNTGNQPFLCYPSNISLTGFTANFSCPVLIGGSGASGIHNVVHCQWQAMGF